MKKIALVAGGAGFLGSHFCEALLKKNWQVICADNLITGKISNIARLKNNPNFIFINHDITKKFPHELIATHSTQIPHNLTMPASLKVALGGEAGLVPAPRSGAGRRAESAGDASRWKRADAGIFETAGKSKHINRATAKRYQLIANFACPASPKDYVKFPLETLRVSSLGAENLLELAQKNNCRFFHTSTSEVYGDPKIHPQKENYWGYVNSYGARSMYDEGKRYAEALIYTYRRKYNLNTGTARIFNTYGPRMQPNDGRVVSNFIVQALAGKPLTVYGKGDQSRSFCYVDDEIKGLLKMALSDLEGPINIGNPNEFTILELAKKVIKLTNSKSKIIFQPLPDDDPKQRQPDIALAKKSLNWQPATSLEKGLKKTIKWLETN